MKKMKRRWENKAKQEIIKLKKAAIGKYIREKFLKMGIIHGKYCWHEDKIKNVNGKNFLNYKNVQIIHMTKKWTKLQKINKMADIFRIAVRNNWPIIIKNFIRFTFPNNYCNGKQS